jgi:radical SAM protein with 4Fe4S-binding SPASM domain
MTKYRLRELKIEVNKTCPLYCLHCSSNGGPRATDCLEPGKVSRLIREFADLGGERLCISGGEPLCYEGLTAVIDSCRGANIEVSLYTTGIIRNGGPPKQIPRRLADFLAESDVRVIFSIHGAYAKTHDMLTQVEGSFDNTTTAIEETIAAGARVEVHVVPTAINFSELLDIAELVDSFGVKKMSWLRFVRQGRGLANKRLLQLSERQLTQLAQVKLQLEQRCPDVAIRTGAPFNILCPEAPATCEAGVSVLTIGPDGTASPCDAFKQFRAPSSFGNVLSSSLVEVWRGSEFLHSIRALHESRSESSCASCHLYTRCNSGCLAQKAIASGNLADDRDPDCPLNRAKAVRGEVKAIAVC